MALLEFFVNLRKQMENAFKIKIGDGKIQLRNKGDYSKVDIITNKMNEDQKNYAIEITRECLEMHQSHFDCTKYIKEQLKSKYGGDWCVILHIQDYGDSSFNYFDDCYVYFHMGEFCVKIFKSNNSDKTIRLDDKGDYNKVEILTNKMNEDQKNYAIEITRESLNKHESHFDCAKYISNQFESKYGGNWCVILKAYGYGNSYFTYYNQGYINFTMGEFHVEIFKSNNSDKTIYLIDKGDYNKVEIFTNKMNDDQKNYAIEITRESINMHKSHFECVKYVKDQFDNKYGGNWCVVFNPRGYGDSCFTYYSCYISFTIGEFDVNIGKTHD